MQSTRNADGEAPFVMLFPARAVAKHSIFELRPNKPPTSIVCIKNRQGFLNDPKNETASSTFADEAVTNERSQIKNSGEQTDHLHMNRASITRNPRAWDGKKRFSMLKRMNPTPKAN